MKSIKALHEDFTSGKASPLSVTKESLALIEKRNPELNAFITVLKDSALAEAQTSEVRYEHHKELGPLDGMPIAIKDLIYIEGVRCTAGSKILADNVAQYSSPVVKNLKSAGAVLIGTTNLHEFAAGSTGDNPHFGPARNPWDTTKDSGGSSAGSAVAVAASLAVGALGTDTGGSVRIPAALCGCLGLKPTYGRVSRLGVIPLAPSLDVVGTLNSGAWDAAATLQVIARHDGPDLTTVDAPVPDYISELNRPAASRKIGVPREYFERTLDSGVEARFAHFLSELSGMGFSVIDVDIGGLDQAYSKWLPIRRAEASSFHEKWLRTVPGDYGADVFRTLRQGLEILAVDYIGALNSRPAMMEKVSLAMADCEAMVLPTVRIPAPKIGQEAVQIRGNEVDVYSALNRLNLPFNFFGLPALSIPIGAVDGVPTGAQIVGRLFEESRILALADSIEKELGPYPDPPSP